MPRCRDAEPRCPRAARVAALMTVAAALVTVVLALAAQPASAHATLQRTSPTDDQVVSDTPDTVQLHFDEGVTAAPGGVRIIGPSGDRADRDVREGSGGKEVRVSVEDAGRGTYTVAWRVVSDDGHTITGSFVFHVGEATGAAEISDDESTVVTAVGGVGRWLGYAGSLTAVGAAALVLLGAAGAAARRRLVWLVALGGALGAVGVALGVLAQTAGTTGRGLLPAIGLVPDVVSNSRPIALASVRAGALAVGAALAVALSRRGDRTRAAVAGGVVIAFAGLLAPLAGHPWTATPQAVAVSADALHLLAVSVWIGGLAALAAVIGSLQGPERLVRRFSAAALVTAIVVGVTGTVSAWIMVGSIDGLLDTSSGRLVLAKVAGFTVLVALGWVNREQLVPRLSEGLGELTRSVRTEVVVAGLVLVATSALVWIPPAEQQLIRPFEGTRRNGAVVVALTVEPARPGTNLAHIYITDTGGQPLAVDALEMRAWTRGIPPRRLDAQQVTGDHAVVPSASLTTPGTWTIQVTTVREGTPLQFRFPVRIK